MEIKSFSDLIYVLVVIALFAVGFVLLIRLVVYPLLDKVAFRIALMIGKKFLKKEK